MEVLISVIIATHNRANYLIQAITGLAKQTLDYTSYEVLVVDNASTDNTREIVLEQSKLLPNLTYIYEQTPGTNIARNTGLYQAKGKYVAFIDDDAIANEDWLERIVYTFENTSPDTAIVGGKVSPIWEVEHPPVWITKKMMLALSLVDYSDHPVFLEDKFLFSVNMAFPTKLLTDYGGFDTRLCRKGKNLVTNDEILIAIKLKRDGYKFYYNPAICVKHIIPATRLKESWFIKRAHAQGYSDAIMWRLLEKPSIIEWVHQLGYFLYGFVRNPKHMVYIAKKINPFNVEAFKLKLSVTRRVGYIIGLFS